MPEIRESPVPAGPDSARDAAPAPREHPAVAFLAAAYPDERERIGALGRLT